MRRLYYIPFLICLTISVISALFAIFQSGLLYMEISDRFDCDDATKLTYDILSRVGLDPIIMYGDLEKSKESYNNGNHVWLLVPLGQKIIPVDWGLISFNEQYFEGYPISYSQLVEFVQNDRSTN